MLIAKHEFMCNRGGITSQKRNGTKREGENREERKRQARSLRNDVPSRTSDLAELTVKDEGDVGCIRAKFGQLAGEETLDDGAGGGRMERSLDVSAIELHFTPTVDDVKFWNDVGEMTTQKLNELI